MDRRFLFLSAALLSLLFSCSKEDTGGSDTIDIEAGTTVYGRIAQMDGTPVAYTVVSDGVICTRTGSDGIYQLKSAKKNGLVFICPPAYYTVPRTGFKPEFWETLTSDASTPERHDFTVLTEPQQDCHTRMVFGDIHVFSDESAAQFSNLFVQNVNKTISRNQFKCLTGLTLGDMSWDYHWYKSNYRNTKYIQLATPLNLAVFNTVGNHDHDMKDPDGKWINSRQEIEDTGEDWTVEIPYRQKQGPTCYSWNIGKVHYISMDDVFTIDDGTGTVDGRGCIMGFNDNDIAWLKQDLKYVNPSKPIVLSIHMPLTNLSGTARSAYSGLNRYAGRTVDDMFAPFKGYNLQMVLSAHIHDLYTNLSVKAGDFTVPEYNCGAVCGYFWYPAINAGGVPICNDGAPNGYRIMEWDGEKLSSNVYQALGKNGFYPFRSYDRNNIQITSETTRTEAVKSGFYTKSSENYVYIFIWDWRDGWSIEVTEDGKSLPVENLGSGCKYDPLALFLRSAGVGLGSVSSCAVPLRRVKASSASSTLVITVKDEYGHSATETMTRPKKFDALTYRNEDYSK